MNPMLIVTGIKSDEPNQLAYQVNVTDRASLINTEEDLILALKNTIPAKNGITGIVRISQSGWKITANKSS